VFAHIASKSEKKGQVRSRFAGPLAADQCSSPLRKFNETFAYAGFAWANACVFDCGGRRDGCATTRASGLSAVSYARTTACLYKLTLRVVDWGSSSSPSLARARIGAIDEENSTGLCLRFAGAFRVRALFRAKFQSLFSLLRHEANDLTTSTRPGHPAAPETATGAVRIYSHARSRDPFMKPLATRFVRSQRPRPTPSHVANERRSRCSSLI
jgi:hypothetical protein